MWYAIEGHEESVDTLLKASIPVTLVTLEKPRRITAIAFPDRDLDSALAVLEIPKELYDVKKESTDQANIKLVSLKQKPAKKVIKATEAKEKDLEQQWQIKKQEVKELYLRECQNLLPTNEYFSDQDTISSSLAENANSLKKNLMEYLKSSGQEKFSREYDLIKNMDFVKKIRVEAGVIYVWTRSMTVQHGWSGVHVPGKRFTIWLNGSIDIYPITHWKYHGHPCLGDLENEIPALIRKWELAVVAKLLMQFIINDEFYARGKWESIPSQSWDILRRKKGFSLSRLADKSLIVRFFYKLLGIDPGLGTDQNKIKFIQMCQRYYQREISGLESRVEYDQRNLQKSFSHLVKRIQCDKLIREKLQKPEEKEEMLKKLSDDFKKLASLNDVSRVEVIDSKVRVLTKELTIDTPDGQYSLGRYYITIGLDGSLEIKNVLPMQYDHPIVKQGQPVFEGQMTVAIAKYIGRLELSSACQIIIDKLKNYNQDEGLVGLDVWEGGSHD